MDQREPVNDVTLKQGVTEHEEVRHKKWMLRCYELASRAQRCGNHPFGSLLVKEDHVVLETENSVVSSHDVTAHAELKLIRQATACYDASELNQMTLYSSTEPCVMCIGAIYWAGIRSIVYGVGADELGELVGEKFIWPSRELLTRSNDPINVYGPILSEQGMDIHRVYWG